MLGVLGRPKGDSRLLSRFRLPNLPCLPGKLPETSLVFHEQAFCMKITRGNSNVHLKTSHTMMMMMMMMVTMLHLTFMFVLAKWPVHYRHINRFYLLTSYSQRHQPFQLHSSSEGAYENQLEKLRINRMDYFHWRFSSLNLLASE